MGGGCWERRHTSFTSPRCRTTRTGRLGASTWPAAPLDKMANVRGRSPLASTRRRGGACAAWPRAAPCRSSWRWRRSAPRCGAGCAARAVAAAPGRGRPSAAPSRPPALPTPLTPRYRGSLAPRIAAPSHTALRLMATGDLLHTFDDRRSTVGSADRRTGTSGGAMWRRRVPSSQWTPAAARAPEHMIGGARGGAGREARTQVSPVQNTWCSSLARTRRSRWTPTAQKGQGKYEKNFCLGIYLDLLYCIIYYSYFDGILAAIYM